MKFGDTLKENLSSAVQSNAEQRQNILPDVLKKTIEDTKVPQAYLLRVFKALREQIAKHNKDIGDWGGFLQNHQGQMKLHEERISRYHQEFERVQQIKQGEPGLAGKDGVNAEAPALEEIVQAVLPHIPAPMRGEDGKDATVDEERLISLLLERVKKEKPFDMSHIKGAQDFIFNTSQKSVRIKFEELMHGGGSSSGGGLSIITVTGVVDDSNVTFSTATQPTLLNINGAFYQQVGGAITWSYAGTTITLSSPVGVGGQIYGVA